MTYGLLVVLTSCKSARTDKCGNVNVNSSDTAMTSRFCHVKLNSFPKEKKLLIKTACTIRGAHPKGLPDFSHPKSKTRIL